MSDQALKNAEGQRDQLLERRKALTAEIAEVDKKLATAEAFIHQWHAFAEDKPVEHVNIRITGVSSELHGSKVDVSASTRPAGNSRKEHVAMKARQIIVEARQPVSRADLYKRLVAEGFVMNGTDPEMVLSTMLWRTRDIAGLVNLKGRGYWLRELPWAAANYIPGSGVGMSSALAQYAAQRTEPWDDFVEKFLADFDSSQLREAHKLARFFDHPSSLNPRLVERAELELNRKLSADERAALGHAYASELARQVAELTD